MCIILYFAIGYIFWIGFESEKLKSLYWYLERLKVIVWRPQPWSRYANAALKPR